LKNVSVVSQFYTCTAMFAITFPSHTSVREEIGCPEQLQVMPLNLTLTHTASGGLQGWIHGFSKAFF